MHTKKRRGATALSFAPVKQSWELPTLATLSLGRGSLASLWSEAKQIALAR
jgi:hypothetical protein